MKRRNDNQFLSMQYIITKILVTTTNFENLLSTCQKLCKNENAYYTNSTSQYYPVVHEISASAPATAYSEWFRFLQIENFENCVFCNNVYCSIINISFINIGLFIHFIVLYCCLNTEFDIWRQYVGRGQGKNDLIDYIFI
jgi:hypothetical protein